MNGDAMLRELMVELSVYDVNGREQSYTVTWAAPGPLHITTGLTDLHRGFRAQLRISDPLAGSGVAVSG